jgi:hypothetical protein
LTEPYPNAYIDDDDDGGEKLVFSGIRMSDNLALGARVSLKIDS